MKVCKFAAFESGTRSGVQGAVELKSKLFRGFSFNSLWLRALSALAKIKPRRKPGPTISVDRRMRKKNASSARF